MYKQTPKQVDRLVQSNVSDMDRVYKEFASLYEAESFLRAGTNMIKDPYMNVRIITEEITIAVHDENPDKIKELLGKYENAAQVVAQHAIVAAAIAKRTRLEYFPEETRKVTQAELEEFFQEQ